MDKLSALSVAFSNVTPLQAAVLQQAWAMLFDAEDSGSLSRSIPTMTVDSFYDDSSLKLKLIAEVSSETLPFTNVRLLEEVLHWICNDVLLQDSTLFTDVRYDGAFVVTEKHLQAPLNVFSLLPKVSVSNTQTKEKIR